VQTVVHLVRNYYSHQDFCIITPYDAQRAAIQKELKDKDLPWDRVFNVDSFQGQLGEPFREETYLPHPCHSGNEADFVIVSVVRSGSHSGFLSSKNRMNVILTRCRKGLIIVSSKSFLRGDGGRNTLLGELEQEWVTRFGPRLGDNAWVDWRQVAERPGKCRLPHSRDTVTTGRTKVDSGKTSTTTPTSHRPPLPSASSPPKPRQTGRPALAVLDQPSKQTPTKVVNHKAPPTSPPQASVPIQPPLKVSGTEKRKKSTNMTSEAPKHMHNHTPVQMSGQSPGGTDEDPSTGIRVCGGWREWPPLPMSASNC